jgi:hypothetical protein
LPNLLFYDEQQKYMENIKAQQKRQRNPLGKKSKSMPRIFSTTVKKRYKLWPLE